MFTKLSPEKARRRLMQILLRPLPAGQGRVGGPGAAGELAPGDGGLGAEAEQVGDDGGRELAGELQECAGAAGGGVDADAGQPVADGGGQDGLPGMQAGEQSRAGAVGGDLAEVAAVAGEVVQVAGQGFGDADRGGAQSQRGALGVEADVAGGEAGDAAGALAEQQDEQAGDAVAGVVAVVVQEAAGQCPPLVLGERDCRVRAGHGRDSECAVAVAACPGQEVPDLVAAGRAGQQVGVEVGLTAGGQVQAAAGKPAGEVDGGLESGGLSVADPGGQRCLAGFGAGVAQQPPGGVAAQRPARVLVRCPVQDGGDVAFEAGQVGVPCGQGAQGGSSAVMWPVALRCRSATASSAACDRSISPLASRARILYPGREGWSQLITASGRSAASSASCSGCSPRQVRAGSLPSSPASRVVSTHRAQRPL